MKIVRNAFVRRNIRRPRKRRGQTDHIYDEMKWASLFIHLRYRAGIMPILKKEGK